MGNNYVSSSSSATSGVGFLGLLSCCLVVLKLLGHIKASWFLVFLPVLIPFIIVFIIGFIFLLLILFGKK